MQNESTADNDAREILRALDRDQLLEVLVLAVRLLDARQRPSVPDDSFPVVVRH
jgi:hypothetical protein